METLYELKNMILAEQNPSQLGVVEAHDEHSLEAVAKATTEGFIRPVLFGREEEIKKIWNDLNKGLPLPKICPTLDAHDSLRLAMKWVRDGKLDCIMKGKIETGILMKSALNSDTGIRKNDTLSLIGLMQSPYYKKTFIVTDVGLITYPDLKQKVAILKNAVWVSQQLGIEKPKVGVLTAVEKVNSKMPETLDAIALKEMCYRGELGECIVEGPISYDLCMDPEAASIKGYESPVAGDVDILLVPDIVAGNLLSKGLLYTGGAKTCGSVVGAMVPIVLTSRSATSEDKYLSLLLAAVLGRNKRYERS